MPTQVNTANKRNGTYPFEKSVRHKFPKEVKKVGFRSHVQLKKNTSGGLDLLRTFTATHVIEPAMLLLMKDKTRSRNGIWAKLTFYLNVSLFFNFLLYNTKI